MVTKSVIVKAEREVGYRFERRFQNNNLNGNNEVPCHCFFVEEVTPPIPHYGHLKGGFKSQLPL